MKIIQSVVGLGVFALVFTGCGKNKIAKITSTHVQSDPGMPPWIHRTVHRTFCLLLGHLHRGPGWADAWFRPRNRKDGAAPADPAQEHRLPRGRVGKEGKTAPARTVQRHTVKSA